MMIREREDMDPPPCCSPVLFFGMTTMTWNVCVEGLCFSDDHDHDVVGSSIPPLHPPLVVAVAAPAAHGKGELESWSVVPLFVLVVNE